jgi:hypothetical protein
MQNDQVSDNSGAMDDRLEDARAGAGRERQDAEGAFGGGKNGTRKGSLTDTGVNPSDLPSGDSPLRLMNTDKADPQNSRPTAPYTADDE